MIAQDVAKSTDNEQDPWTNANLTPPVDNPHGDVLLIPQRKAHSLPHPAVDAYPSMAVHAVTQSDSAHAQKNTTVVPMQSPRPLSQTRVRPDLPSKRPTSRPQTPDESDNVYENLFIRIFVTVFVVLGGAIMAGFGGECIANASSPWCMEHLPNRDGNIAMVVVGLLMCLGQVIIFVTVSGEIRRRRYARRYGT